MRNHINLIDGLNFRACMNCGHLWASVDPIELKSMVEKIGRKESEVTVSERWEKFSSCKKTLIAIFVIGSAIATAIIVAKH